MLKLVLRIATLLGHEMPGKSTDLDERLKWMAQTIANLVDEVEYLRERLAMLEDPEMREAAEAYYREYKLNRMYSSAGSVPPPVSRWGRYLLTNDEIAEQLIPDRDERERTIRALESLS